MLLVRPVPDTDLQPNKSEDYEAQDLSPFKNGASKDNRRSTHLVPVNFGFVSESICDRSQDDRCDGEWDDHEKLELSEGFTRLRSRKKDTAYHPMYPEPYWAPVASDGSDQDGERGNDLPGD